MDHGDAAAHAPAIVTPRHGIQRRGRCEVWSDADPDAVWAIVADVTRVGSWSHECVGAEWLDGADRAVSGARFRGRNRSSIFRWGRVCEVVRAEAGEFTFRTVPTAFYPDSTEWTIRIEAAGGRTRIEQSFVVVKDPPAPVAALYGLVIPAHRNRTAALTADLLRLAAAAGATTAA